MSYEALSGEQMCSLHHINLAIQHNRHIVVMPYSIDFPYTHLCTMTLFCKPASVIVALSSSSVRLGKVVPMV